MPKKEIKTEPIPVVALRGLVLFPCVTLHFDVGRKKSVNAIQRAMTGGQRIFLSIQDSDASEDEPIVNDICTIGTIAFIKQVLRMKNGVLRVVVEGEERAIAHSIHEEDDAYIADVQIKKSSKPRVTAEYKTALLRHLRSVFDDYLVACSKVPADIAVQVNTDSDLDTLTDFIASNIPISNEYKLELLEEFNPIKRAEALITVLISETGFLEIENEIGEKARAEIDGNQRDYYLREQMKIISQELGGDEAPEDEAHEYHDKINGLMASDEVKEKLLKEAYKLFRMPFGSHEATVIRGYLDTCCELPWEKYTTDKIDITAARKQLDHDHYGMEKVKERILELLAVYRLNPDIKGQIICLSGPPGVGKTSIAKSVATCMDRKYARISLGGVQDEAEIRGHRKTYIGAMPGRIITAIKNVGSGNPLILLDEIDKLASDHRGDPASALLEALDSEQNNTFNDRYVDMPYDLSKVLFITTANNLATIPPALLDRMEVIELPSYTREDKFKIAKGYLVKKQLKKHGLTAKTCKICDSALYGVIDGYTREAGVRRLERTISTLCRKAAVMLVENKTEKITIKAVDLESLLGPQKYKNDALLAQDEVGTVNGLAWTSVGGELMRLEVAVLEGTGKIHLTGSLGDVMKESAETAVSYVRSVARRIGIETEFYKTKDIHIHATEAAVPKDGPSAGVAMATALISALTGIPILRNVAMTGEISLRGRILPIGGLKEKTMAAYRAGIKTVFIPEDNKSDLSEIDPVVRDSLKFICTAEAMTVIVGSLNKAIRIKAHGETEMVMPIVPISEKSRQGGRQNELQ